MKRIVTVLTLAAAIVAGSATAASARPVPDKEIYCGPGNSYTVYDLRTDRLVTRCVGKVHIPRVIQMRWF